ARFYQRSGIASLVRPLARLAPLRTLAAMDALLPRLGPSAGPLPELTPAIGPRRGAPGRPPRRGAALGEAARDPRPVWRPAAAGYDVVAPRAQECCGALHLHAGRLDEYREMGERLMVAFDPALDVIVVNAAGCGSALKECARWIPGDRAESFARKVRDVSEVLHGADLPLR